MSWLITGAISAAAWQRTVRMASRGVWNMMNGVREPASPAALEFLPAFFVVPGHAGVAGGFRLAGSHGVVAVGTADAGVVLNGRAQLRALRSFFH